MKKALTVLLTFVLLFSVMAVFSGCGSNDKGDIDSSRDFETDDEIKDSNKDKEADSRETFDDEAESDETFDDEAESEEIADDEASSEVVIEEEAIVLRYDLCDIEYADVDVSDYEYNYIEFNTENSTYYLENKVKYNGIVSRQSGKYEIDQNGNLTITNDDKPAQNYLLMEEETAQFTDDILYIESEKPGYRVSITLQLQSEQMADDEASSEVIVEEESDVLRYDLCDIVFANIVVADYEYNYIEFNTENSTYYLENKVKANGIVSRQSGKYEIDRNGNLTITNDDKPAQNYIAYVGETAQFIDDELYVEAEIPGYGSVSLTYQVQQ